jgi:hypothetical protein
MEDKKWRTAPKNILFRLAPALADILILAQTIRAIPDFIQLVLPNKTYLMRKQVQ